VTSGLRGVLDWRHAEDRDRHHQRRWQSSVVASTVVVSPTIVEVSGGHGLRLLSLQDAQRVSFLCMTTAMEFLPVNMQHPDMLKVVEAYHAIGRLPDAATPERE